MSNSATNTSKLSKLPRIYKKLHRRFGPQGWWPTTPRNAVLPVYTAKVQSSLTEDQIFEICLGAFLTQNTNWNNVVKVLALLTKNKKLNFRSLQTMKLSSMERAFRSSGYFRQKAQRVKGFLQTVQKETGGSLRRYLKGQVPDLRKKLLELKGIGPETADSMILYAAQKPTFVVDAYTRRLGKRWGILKGIESYDEIQTLFTQAVPLSAPLFNQFHALIVELAKNFCKKTPECSQCPVQEECSTGRKGD